MGNLFLFNKPVIYRKATTANPAPISAPSTETPTPPGAAAVDVAALLAPDTTLDALDATLAASLVAVENAPPAPDVIVLATPLAPDVIVVKTPPAPDVTTVNTLSAPEVISVARLVPTLPAPEVMTVATEVATDSTVEAMPVPTEAAPEVITEMREESWAEARELVARGRRMVERRMVMD